MVTLNLREGQAECRLVAIQLSPPPWEALGKSLFKWVQQIGAIQAVAAKEADIPACTGKSVASQDSPKKDSNYWEEDFVIGDSSSDESEEDLTGLVVSV